jgi:AraC-like DNA-binding protein
VADTILIAKTAFQGVEDMSRLIQNTDITGVQLRSGVQRGRILYASADGFEFSAGHYEADIRSRGVLHPYRVGLGVTISRRGQSTQWGETAQPGDVFIWPGGVEHDGRVAGETTYAALSVDVSRLVELGGGDAWVANGGIWERRHHYRAPAPVRDRICREISEFSRVLAGPEGAMSDRRLKSFEKDLVESFLSGIAFATDKPGSAAGYRSAKLVRAVEDWVAGKAPEPIRISDICGQLGLSRRSLERAFRETLDMGPAQYLMARRLSAARLMLAKADPQAVSVTDVAIDQGFWELGRFAVRYRQMFGEKPSETLHRH